MIWIGRKAKWQDSPNGTGGVIPDGKGVISKVIYTEEKVSGPRVKGDCFGADFFFQFFWQEFLIWGLKVSIILVPLQRLSADVLFRWRSSSMSSRSALWKCRWSASSKRCAAAPLSSVGAVVLPIRWGRPPSFSSVQIIEVPVTVETIVEKIVEVPVKHIVEVPVEQIVEKIVQAWPHSPP